MVKTQINILYPRCKFNNSYILEIIHSKGICLFKKEASKHYVHATFAGNLHKLTLLLLKVIRYYLREKKLHFEVRKRVCC